VKRIVRNAGAILLLAGGILVFSVVLSVFLTLRAGAGLEDGRAALIDAQDALAVGDFAGATEHLREAQSAFIEANTALSNPFIALTGRIPLIGRTPDAVKIAADAGALMTDAADDLTTAVGRLQGDLENLSFSGARIPVHVLGKFQPAIVQALDTLESAETLADGIATTFVPHQVTDAGDQLRLAIDRSTATLRSAAAILRALPVLSGMDEPRRYFLAPQDLAELRGTGGALRYWAIMKIDHGRISLHQFHFIEELADDASAWPNQELRILFADVAPTPAWEFANVASDGPTSASLITSLWEGLGRTPIDGVILVDPHALRAMLETTGPLSLSGLPVTLSTGNVVPFLSHDAFLTEGGDTAGRRYVGVAALRIFQRFLSQARGYDALRAVVDSASGGHILMNSSDPAVQADLQLAGITGAAPVSRDGDVFAVAINNLTGSRVDYYVRRSVDYVVTLLPDGRARARATVHLANESPTGVLTDAERSLLEPTTGPADLSAGDAFEQVLLQCGAGCRIQRATVDGRELAIADVVIDGRRTTTGAILVPPGGSATATFWMDLGRTWEGDGAQGTYALTIPSPPAILPTAGTVTIHAPEGMLISTVDAQLDAHGSSARWTGELPDVLRLELRFQRGTFGRIWWDLTHLRG
jgi:hypothetical protein